jgi:hypothetical protein
LGKSSKVTRPVIQNLATPLSDIKSTPVDSDSSADEKPSHSHSRSNSPKPKLVKSSQPLKSSKGKSKDSSWKVSAVKHQSANGFREDSRKSISSLDQLVDLKAHAKEMKIQHIAAQQVVEESQHKLEVEKLALGMENVSDEVKAKANDILLQLMS